MSKVVLYVFAALNLGVLSPSMASPSGDGAFETIRINADEASEDMRPGVLHFKGHFRMQSNEWHLESALATVYGPPDRSDKIHLEGSPALFFVNLAENEGQGVVEATAPVMEYQRSGNLLTLSGGAILKLDGEVIRSAVIEYNISTDRYRAGGVDGVMIEVPGVN